MSKKPSKDRVAAYRARQAEKGLHQYMVYASRQQGPQLVNVAAILQDNPDFEIAMLRDTRTGRLIRA